MIYYTDFEVKFDFNSHIDHQTDMWDLETCLTFLVTIYSYVKWDNTYTSQGSSED